MSVDLSKGVWFQSAVSGLWYSNHNSAGSISCVRVEGLEFMPALDASLSDLIDAESKVPEALVHDPFHGLKIPKGRNSVSPCLRGSSEVSP